MIAWLAPLHLALTSAMLGLVLFVHTAHYPLFDQVPASSFKQYHSAYIARSSWAIPALMVGEAASGALLLWAAPSSLLASSAVALAAIWGITFFWSVPAHEQLAQGFSQSAHQALLNSNLWRVALWALRTILLLAWFSRNGR